MKIPDGRIGHGRTRARGGGKKNFARERATGRGGEGEEGGRLHCMPTHGSDAEGEKGEEGEKNEATPKRCPEVSTETSEKAKGGMQSKNTAMEVEIHRCGKP